MNRNRVMCVMGRWNHWGAVIGTMTCLGVTRLAVAQQTVATESRPNTANAVLERPITITLDNATIESAIDAITAVAGIRVQYQGHISGATVPRVTLHAVRMPLGIALEYVLANTRLVPVVLTTDLIMLRATSSRNSLAGEVRGTITDAATHFPLRGATVTIDDGTHGVVASTDGTYRLLGIPAGPHRLIIRAIGYTRATRVLTMRDDATVLEDVALIQSPNILDQVVVTGTVIATERKAIPNAMTVVTAKQIEERGITRIDQLFRGDIPGLFAVPQASDATLDEVTMFSRGATALSVASAGTSHFTNPIKTYVDGVEFADAQYLSQLDPKSIERIEILTGPQASTIYGSNALNGVMQIFTKRGTTSAPQLTINLLSGWVQNNSRNALTPQHDYGAQLNGLEGRVSYNAGGSWEYMGPWTPAKQMTRLSGFGGARLSLSTALGSIITDVTLRRSGTQSLSRGAREQGFTDYQASGWYGVRANSGVAAPKTSTLTGQTFGLTISYSPASWWSHELGAGEDLSDNGFRLTSRGYTSFSDTGLYLSQNHTDRRSFHYTTITQIPLTSRMQVNITAGSDAWQRLTSSISLSSQTLTGTLIDVESSPFVSRQPEHNAGAFVQTQIALLDRLFVTYGLRAEWNPNYGATATPSYAPRYGAAYSFDGNTPLGILTAKVRGSYGRATRPPAPAAKRSTLIDPEGAVYWGPGVLATFANPDLEPEFQRGGEGGLELYLGTRGSLVVTRYNQTVENLITETTVDSTNVLPVWQVVYGDSYFQQHKNLNIGNVRNQGWEFQGSINTGPFTTRGTYSWTKSRTIGIDPRYRAQFTARDYPQYQVGATFQILPEHTWALGTTYAHTHTTVALNLSGNGRFTGAEDFFFLRNLRGSIRLPQNRMNLAPSGYVNVTGGFAQADLTAIHPFSPWGDAMLQIQNLMDHYTTGEYARYVTLGRQTKMGIRMRLQ